VREEVQPTLERQSEISPVGMCGTRVWQNLNLTAKRRMHYHYLDDVKIENSLKTCAFSLPFYARRNGCGVGWDEIGRALT
jgi:hypothetical protein